MKFFAVAALFATAAMAAPGAAPVPGAAAAAGNGNAPVINQTQQKTFTDACSAKGNHPVCCDQIDTSKTTAVNQGLLGGLLGEGLGGVLNNLVGGEPGACSGLVSALGKQCQTSIGCCQQNAKGDNYQSGLLNLNLQAPCLLSNGL